MDQRHNLYNLTGIARGLAGRTLRSIQALRDQIEQPLLNRTLETSYSVPCPSVPVMSPHGDRDGCAHTFMNTPSWDVASYALFKRPLGRSARRPSSLVEPYLARQLPGLLKEHQYGLNDVNKIFAARWLNERQVIVGTKCNKLLALDLLTNQIVRIPMLQSRCDRLPSDCPCGIHSIAVNPSRTLLATGGENVKDVAVYRLPTFDPVAVGEDGHDDWIFDLLWLDDQIIVSGSRDSQISLWRVRDDSNDEDMTSVLSSCHRDKVGISYGRPSTCIAEPYCSRDVVSSEPLRVPSYGHIKPLASKLCEKAEKVRAFAYNERRQELAVLSLNAALHLWDAQTFTQKKTRRLRHVRENVCLTVSTNDGVYAIGSQSHVTLVDERMAKEIGYITSKQRGCGVRSLNSMDTVLTIGTGAGAVYFFDRRINKYLELNCSHPCTLTAGAGWLRRDETYREFFAEQEYPNAIYVHCFDESGTRLFAAGGPLPAGLWGNYAGLWL